MRVILELTIRDGWTPSDVSHAIQRAFAKAQSPLFEPLSLEDEGVILDHHDVEIGSWKLEEVAAMRER